MKRVLILIIALLAALSGSAQTKSFEFYYIAHDRNTPVNDLCKRLNNVYESADYDEECAVIFYLPNYDEPLVVVMNLPGDNRKDFEKLIGELRTKSHHQIYADNDYENILDLVNKYDFIDDSANRTYSSVLFCWYVNPEFWMMKYNEMLIASLYFDLELDKYKNYVTVETWHAADDGLDERVDMDMPFGSKNLCGDMPFMLLQY